MSKPPQDSTPRKCQAHCSGCDSCFSSDSAFDRHRGGSFRENTRCCWPEEAEDRVRLIREDGVCEIGFAVPTLGRHLWGVNASWRRNHRETAAIEAADDPGFDSAA